MTSSLPDINLDPYLARLDQLDPFVWSGEVVELVGLLIESRGPAAAIGDFCEILASGGRVIRTQVIGFRNGNVLSMALEEIDGLRLGDPIVARTDQARVGVGPALLGRVLDGFGRPIDSQGEPEVAEFYDLYKSPPNPLEREHITEPLVTGIRAIDGTAALRPRSTNRNFRR